MKTTKKSLILSAVSLVISIVLLIGTTLAWFTDSVTNKNNTIQAGNLEVKFEYRALTGETDYKAVPDQNTDAGILFTDTKWEPGKTNGVDLRVTNAGNLALNWELYFKDIQVVDSNNDGVEANIAEVLDVYVVSVDATSLEGAQSVGKLSELAGGFVTGGSLTEGNSGEFAVVLKMDETAGNQYQNCSVTFSVELRATQAASEYDGFGNNTYDAMANGSPDNNDWAQSIAGSITVQVAPTGDTILTHRGATVVVPAGTVEEGVDELTLTIKPTATPDGIIVDSALQQAQSYEITVTGIPADNQNEIEVTLPIGKGLSGVKLYHKGALVSGATYNAETGNVVFKTTSFSPFSVVWDRSWSGGTDDEGLQTKLWDFSSFTRNQFRVETWYHMVVTEVPE